MFIAHISTTAGQITIGLVGLQKHELQGPFEALLSTLTKVSSPIVLTSTHSVVREAPLGTAATLTFKYLGSRFLEFADQEAFFASVNEHLARRVFQCAEDFEVDEDGRITGEFEYFELIAEESPRGAAPTMH